MNNLVSVDAAPPGKLQRSAIVLISGGILLIIAALILTRSMGHGVNHDEHQFVASAVLLAEDGLLPYRDFAYFHVPNLTFLYGLIFYLTSGAYLVAARAVSAASAFLLVAFIFLLPFRLFRERSLWTQLALSVLSVALLIFSPMFAYTSGRVWNHDLPTLLAVAAFFLHIYGQGRRRAGLWLFLSGLAVGAAAFTRLSFVLLFAPFILYIFAAQRHTLRRRLILLGWFLCGGVIAALPTAYLAALAPGAFFFDNVEYARLNTQFRAATGYQSSMSLAGKLSALFFQWLLPRPGNLIVVLVFALLTLPHSLRRAAWRSHPHHLFLLFILTSLFVGALAPTPSWSQYYFALFPFFIIGALWGLHDFHASWLDRRLFWALAILIVLLCVFLSFRNYRHIRDLFQPQNWYAVKVQKLGIDVGRFFIEGERVLTNAPLYPLEGGVDIYPEFATGPFAMRVASLLSEGEQERYGFASPERMEQLLAAAPPRGVLVEVDLSEEGDPAAEQEVAPLRAYSARHNYASLVLNDELTLWLRPLAEWDETVRLLHSDSSVRTLTPGATLPLILFLDSQQVIDSDLNVIVRLVGPNGLEVVRSEGWPWGRPTSTWQPGEIWYDGHDIRLPNQLPPGPYRLEVSFYDPQAAAPLSLTAIHRGKAMSDWLVLDILHVQSAEDSPSRPQAQVARFGDTIDLLDVHLTSDHEPMAPGDTLQLELIWRAVGRPPRDLTLFLHLVDAQGNLATQWDRPPLNGFAPTSLWRTGDVFTDAHLLQLPVDLPPGDYRIMAGLYDVESLQRLAVTARSAVADDALQVGAIRVR